eukprot:GHRQ01020280.1.p1 GENE.GHRQ01020280.1~~GHRQ01020280.1.p1  ORF type:complete len:137 (-),score=46.83 GHRQ01020280.1:27-437(-)
MVFLLWWVLLHCTAPGARVAVDLTTAVQPARQLHIMCLLLLWSDCIGGTCSHLPLISHTLWHQRQATSDVCGCVAGWCCCRAPDNSGVKPKMMYASTKDFFKGFLDGIGAELQANEPSEISEEEIRERVVSNMTRK